MHFLHSPDCLFCDLKIFSLPTCQHNADYGMIITIEEGVGFRQTLGE